MLTQFTVGKRVPSPFCDTATANGAIFTLDAEGAAFIAIYLSDMTHKEIKQIQKNPIETGFFSESRYWLGLIQIGKSQYELSFNPVSHYRHRGNFSNELFRASQIVQVMGIDSHGMTLKAVRAVTYPHKFLDSLYFTFADMVPDDVYDDIYDVFLNGLRTRSVQELWDMSEKSGAFGEKD
jgi:hypothetical protein